jgi:hypothetical protein
LKGIMFDLLEATVSATHGAHVWDDLLEATGLTGAYTTLGNYPDRPSRDAIARDVLPRVLRRPR